MKFSLTTTTILYCIDHRVCLEPKLPRQPDQPGQSISQSVNQSISQSVNRNGKSNKKKSSIKIVLFTWGLLESIIVNLKSSLGLSIGVKRIEKDQEMRELL
jgi:hypothetical protein